MWVKFVILLHLLRVRSFGQIQECICNHKIFWICGFERNNKSKKKISINTTTRNMQLIYMYF